MEWTFDYYGGYDAEDTWNPLGPQEMVIVSCFSSSGGYVGPVNTAPTEDDTYQCFTHLRSPWSRRSSKQLGAASFPRLEGAVLMPGTDGNRDWLTGARCAKLVNPRGVGEKCVADVDCASNQCLSDRTCGDGL